MCWKEGAMALNVAPLETGLFPDPNEDRMHSYVCNSLWMRNA